MRFHRIVTIALLGVLGLSSISSAGVPTRRKSDRDAGKAVWTQSCWQCHGRRANGLGPAASALSVEVPALKDQVTSDRFPDFIAVIREGRGAMPAYGDVLTKREAKRVLIYLQDIDKPQAVDSAKKSGKAKRKGRKGRKARPKPSQVGKRKDIASKRDAEEAKPDDDVGEE